MPSSRSFVPTDLRNGRPVPSGKLENASSSLRRELDEVIAWRDTRTRTFSRGKKLSIVLFLYQTICHECYVVLHATRAENTLQSNHEGGRDANSLCLLHVIVRFIGRDARMRSSLFCVKYLEFEPCRSSSGESDVTLSFEDRRYAHSRQYFSATSSTSQAPVQ